MVSAGHTNLMSVSIIKATIASATDSLLALPTADAAEGYFAPLASEC